MRSTTRPQTKPATAVSVAFEWNPQPDLPNPDTRWLLRAEGVSWSERELTMNEPFNPMRFVTKCCGAIFILVLWISIASAQAALKQPVAPDVTSPATDQTEANQTPPASEPTVWIHLVGGRRMQVDEVLTVADGIWYTRGNVTTFLDSASILRIERSEPPRKDLPAAVVAGSGRWKISDSTRVEDFFMSRFKRPLPLTAFRTV